MNDAAGRNHTRNRNRRTFRLETLEGRELLSGTRAFGSHGFSYPPLPGPLHPVSVIHGQVHGSAASDGLYGGTPVRFSSFSGSGTFQQFGGVLFGTNVRATPASAASQNLALTSGDGLFITSRGGAQLRVAYTGTTTPGANGTDVATLTGAITGGTRRFDNAKGTFFATGTIGRGVRAPLSWKVTFDLNPPR